MLCFPRFLSCRRRIAEEEPKPYCDEMRGGDYGGVSGRFSVATPLLAFIWVNASLQRREAPVASPLIELGMATYELVAVAALIAGSVLWEGKGWR